VSQTLLSKETGLLFSSSVAIDFSTSGNLNKYSLAVTRVAMEEIKPRLAIGDGVRLDQSRPGVRMLRGLLNVVWSDLGRMTPVELDFARTALLTLLAAAGPEEEFSRQDDG
jgi:hypothetical protein